VCHVSIIPFHAIKCSCQKYQYLDAGNPTS
jgi:hypothetical protein